MILLKTVVGNCLATPPFCSETQTVSYPAITGSHGKMHHEAEQHRRKAQRAAFLAAIYAAVSIHKRDLRFAPRSEKQYTNAIGELYGPEEANRVADRLLNGSDDRFKHLFRMSQACFRSLVHWLKARTGLKDSRYLSADLKLMVFLNVCAHNEAQRTTGFTFCISQATVSRIIEDSLPRFRKLHAVFVRPKPDDWLDPVYELDPKHRQFSGCIGAIDGTHLHAFIPHLQQKRWYCRKGYISQNVFAAVRSDYSFSFVMAGAEGSMADATLVHHAFAKGFHIPKDRFYLGDAGFGSRKGILIPFPATRYHLQDWRDANNPPESAKELYNLRHSRIRVVVEQAFGLLKRTWKIVRTSAPEYTLKDQIGFVIAVTALQNFIIAFNKEDVPLQEKSEEILEMARARASVSVGGKEPLELRYQIAKKAWRQYLDLKVERRRIQRKCAE